LKRTCALLAVFFRTRAISLHEYPIILNVSMVTAAAGGSQNSQPQANPAKAQEEAELQKRDKTRMESEANHTAATTPDRSNGGASPSNKGGGNGHGQEPPTLPTASYADLVRQINTLQQQVIAEQDKNKRLKGGA